MIVNPLSWDPDTDDVGKLARRYEDERFLVRDYRARLQEHFREMVNYARGESRLVFFIDDLDRCIPQRILSMLEALKLYLNVPGCVYFLGVDREALERGIRHLYKEVEIDERNYLDKIIQLPFTIPPIAAESMAGFIESLLPSELRICRDLLVQTLGGNPRQVKRFINTLLLSHELATALDIPAYDCRVLAALLLIQNCEPRLYDTMSAVIASGAAPDPRFDTSQISSNKLRDGINGICWPKSLGPYFHLTDPSRLAENIRVTNSVALSDVVASHKAWLDNRENGRRADLSGMNLTKASLPGMNLQDAQLHKVTLSGAVLIGTNFRNADLTDANLEHAQLMQADLSHARLSSSYLRGAQLNGAKLVKADLGQAFLRETSLAGADLRECNLKSAHFDRTDLRGANLTNVTGLTSQQLQGAIVDVATVLPPSFPAKTRIATQ